VEAGNAREQDMTALRGIVLASGAWTLLAAPFLCLPVQAQPVTSTAVADTDERLTALEQRLQDIRQQLAQMRRQNDSAPRAQPVAPVPSAAVERKDRNDAPRLDLTNGRLSVVSADGDFSFSLRSLVQFDTGYFAQGRGPAGIDLNSGTNFRRAQFGFVGTAWRDWSYNFTYDFGGNGVEKSGYIYTASLQYDFKPFAIKLGAFAPFAGLDDSTGSGDLVFLERASAADIARGIAGAPGREGIQLWTHGARYLLSLAFTGAKTTQDGFDEQQAVVGRAAFLAVDRDNFKWLLDADMTHVFRFTDTAAGVLSVTTIALQAGPELAIGTTRTVDTGKIAARGMTEWGLETALQAGRLYGQGGYFHFTVQRDGVLPDPGFSGWYGMAAFSLTGEQRPYSAGKASFAGLKPDHPLGKGGFGAFEVAARYSSVDLAFDPFAGAAKGGITGGKQDVLGLALNWYPTSGLRFMLNVDRVQVNHVQAPGNDISATAIGLRSQISF
jgi:phosphate-selective porin OprO/OprP